MTCQVRSLETLLSTGVRSAASGSSVLRYEEQSQTVRGHGLAFGVSGCKRRGCKWANDKICAPCANVTGWLHTSTRAKGHLTLPTVSGRIFTLSALIITRQVHLEALPATYPCYTLGILFIGRVGGI